MACMSDGLTATVLIRDYDMIMCSYGLVKTLCHHSGCISRLNVVTTRRVIGCVNFHTSYQRTMSVKSCRLHVNTQHCLVDDALHIRVTGVEPYEPLTLFARMEDDGKRMFSCAHYQADGFGDLDLDNAPSKGGFYTGLEPMGLFWSMKAEPGQKRGIRIMKRNVTTPLVTSLAVHEGHCDDIMDLMKRQPLATTEVYRWYMASNVRRMEIREEGLLGTFFIPKDGGPYPGIIDMFGGIGGTVEHRAALLASRGFAVLALQYIDVSKGFEITSELEYFKGAVEWLLRQPGVIEHSAGMVGVCKGGEMVLLTSIVCPLVKAVVPISSSRAVTLIDKTFAGETFRSFDMYSIFGEKKDDTVWMKKATDKMPQELWLETGIPIERTNARVLLIYGEDDQCTGLPSHDFFMERMRKAGKSHLVESVTYPGAGHLIEPPYMPCYPVTFTPEPPTYFWWGGEPVGHAKAQEDSWKRLQKFLREELTSQDVLQHTPQAKL